jgi:predicted ribosomally synthesized peptide with nif11-like leader
MEDTILEKVKNFLIRLVKDANFAEQFQASSRDRIQKVLQDSGYSFSQADFETAAIQILELKERDEFHDLSEEELIGAIGGWIRYFPRPLPKSPGFPRRPDYSEYPAVQPMYGVIVEPPKKDVYPRLRRDPFPEPIFQPMYGVIIQPEID